MSHIKRFYKPRETPSIPGLYAIIAPGALGIKIGLAENIHSRIMGQYGKESEIFIVDYVHTKDYKLYEKRIIGLMKTAGLVIESDRITSNEMYKVDCLTVYRIFDAIRKNIPPDHLTQEILVGSNDVCAVYKMSSRDLADLFVAHIIEKPFYQRSVDESHVKRLVESIQESKVYFPSPIYLMADGCSFKVLDGLHRLCALKLLELAEISFVVIIYHTLNNDDQLTLYRTINMTNPHRQVDIDDNEYKKELSICIQTLNTHYQYPVVHSEEVPHLKPRSGLMDLSKMSFSAAEFERQFTKQYFTVNLMNERNPGSFSGRAWADRIIRANSDILQNHIPDAKEPPVGMMSKFGRSISKMADFNKLLRHICAYPGKINKDVFVLGYGTVKYPMMMLVSGNT